MTGEHGIRGSLRWAAALSWGERGLTMLFTVVLAAILGPEAFGIVAMALVYLAFVDLALEQGFLTTIVQREQLDRAHLDSAFWVNLVWCLVLAAASFALAGWWAGVNDVPQLQEVIQVMSILVIVSGLTIVQQAYLQRHLRFRQLAIRANVAALVGGITGLVLALAGAGVWSLVAQQIVAGCTSLALLWAVSDWRPGFHFSRSHARDLLGFTSGVYLANIGGFLNRRSDTLLMGLFFGPTVVGIYRLADRFVDSILELTMRPVGLVSLPHLSLLQRDPEALRRTVTTFIRIAILTTLPVLLVFAACSDYVLAVIGPEWEIGSDALKLLCVVGIVKGLVHFTGPLLFAAGEAVLPGDDALVPRGDQRRHGRDRRLRVVRCERGAPAGGHVGRPGARVARDHRPAEPAHHLARRTTASPDLPRLPAGAARSRRDGDPRGRGAHADRRSRRSGAGARARRCGYRRRRDRGRAHGRLRAAGPRAGEAARAHAPPRSGGRARAARYLKPPPRWPRIGGGRTA